MDADRPNAVNTPHTIDAGHVQAEIGLIDLARQWNEASATSLAPGEVNLRVGILADLELNAATTLFTTGPGGRGTGDTVLGGKLNLWGDSGSDALWSTALAVQPQIKLPTAGQRRGNGHVEAGINLPFAMNLPDAIHLGLQITPKWLRNERNTAYAGGVQPAIALDRVLVLDTDVYVEYRAAIAGQSRPNEPIDLGFTRPVGKAVIIDSGVFFGLTRASTSFELATGISVRF